MQMEDEKLKITERYEQKLRRKPLQTDTVESMANYLEDDDDVLAIKQRARQKRSLDTPEMEEEKANRLLAAKQGGDRSKSRGDDMDDEEDIDDIVVDEAMDVEDDD